MKPKRNKLLIAVAAIVVLFVMVAILCFTKRSVSPVLAFNSFGAGKTYDSSVSWMVGVYLYKGQSEYRGQAEWFIPKTSGRLNTIEIAIRANNSSDWLNVSVSEDDNGLPGKALESFQGIAGKKSNPRSATLILKSTAHPALQAGKKYWLCAEPGNDTSTWSWAYNNQYLANGSAYERQQSGWESFGGTRNGAFSVSVIP